MGVICPPDDIVLAHDGDRRLQILVLLVGGVSLAPEVVAGLQREPERSAAIRVLGVQAIEHVGDLAPIRK